jgi:putative DNA primase/helicase
MEELYNEYQAEYHTGKSQPNDPLNNYTNKQLNPTFEPLKNPETFQHINPFAEPERVLKGNEILMLLLEKVEPVDFEALAFPQLENMNIELKELQGRLTNPDGSIKGDSKDQERYKALEKQIDKLKLTEKHLIILPVEEVVKLAEEHNWGLCKNLAFVYIYNGAYWTKVEPQVLQKFLGESAEKMGAGKWRSRYFEYRTKIEKQFICTAYLPTPEPLKNAVLINLRNGTFEVTPLGNRLRTFNREDFMTYQLPFEHNPEAKAPLFMKFLNQVLPDMDRQSVLAEFLGYIFVRTEYLKLEKALLLYGTGANGKSVFYDIVNALLGAENVSSYTLENLTQKEGYYRAMISDKLVNYASEISDRANAAYVKQLASGEDTDGRLPYGEPFIVKNYAKLIFNLNQLPRDVEHTFAYFRRLLIVHFEVTIPEAEQDKQLAKKIIETELSGVFNWVLEGLDRILKNKAFTDSAAINQARDEYATNSDNVKLFLLDNNYKPDPENWVLIKDLYLTYRTYCIEDGCKPLSKHNFMKRMKALKVVIEKRNVGNVAFIIIDPLDVKPF